MCESVYYDWLLLSYQHYTVPICSNNTSGETLLVMDLIFSSLKWQVGSLHTWSNYFLAHSQTIAIVSHCDAGLSNYFLSHYKRHMASDYHHLNIKFYHN